MEQPVIKHGLLTQEVPHTIPKTYCAWVLKQRQTFLDSFAYTDGTTFYLARGPAENEAKQRVALGPCVWRMASGKDGLWDENVGPSLYAKWVGPIHSVKRC